MKRIINCCGFAVLLAFCFGTAVPHTQTTAFTYQGRLTHAGNPANGDFEMQFKLFGEPSRRVMQ